MTSENEEAIKLLMELRICKDDCSVCKLRHLDDDTHCHHEKALNLAIKALERKSYKSESRRWKRRYLDLKAKEKEWLQTFNTESATACYTAVQRLKESVK